MYRLVFRGSRRRKRGFGFIWRKKERPGQGDEGKEARRRENIGESREKEAAHFSCFPAERERRESPTDFPWGMQIRIEISRENVKGPDEICTRRRALRTRVRRWK